jgi:hypothetical protein
MWAGFAKLPVLSVSDGLMGEPHWDESNKSGSHIDHIAQYFHLPLQRCQNIDQIRVDSRSLAVKNTRS